MARKITLDRTFIHQGVFVGPGPVDIDEVFGKRGHDDDACGRVFKDIQKQQDRVRGTQTTPVSEEKKDGSISVTPAANVGSVDTAQQAPAGVAKPAGAAK